MAPLRRLSLAHRRWLLLLIAVALGVRALVPGGWMPVAGPQGVTLALCDGAEAMTAPMRMAMRHGQGAAPMQHHHGAPDQPCAFAAATAAVDLPVLALPVLPPPPRHLAVAARPLTAIGRGLAAPPPPPTGPPAFA